MVAIPCIYGGVAIHTKLCCRVCSLVSIIVVVMAGFSPLVTPLYRTDSAETPVKEKNEVEVTAELVGFGETTTVIGTLSETEAQRLMDRCHEVEERLGHASSFEEREVVLASFLVDVEGAGLLP